VAKKRDWGVKIIRNTFWRGVENTRRVKFGGRGGPYHCLGGGQGGGTD